MKADAIAPKDMARRRHWTLKYVYDLLAAGRIPGARKVGNHWVIPAAALKQLDRTHHRPIVRH
jgi:excisionase family DNA binding protein